jgi:hypothetical protein
MASEIVVCFVSFSLWVQISLQNIAANRSYVHRFCVNIQLIPFLNNGFIALRSHIKSNVKPPASGDARGWVDLYPQKQLERMVG